MKVGVVAVVAAALLLGCSSDDAGKVASEAPTSPVPGGVSVPVPTNTLNTEKPTDAAEPPALPEQATAPPPSVAGPVTARNLPAAQKLGRGWMVYLDPGGAEKGFQGNQSWTRRRDEHQAAFEALPVGCTKALPTSPLPVPQHALQGSYRNAKSEPATVLLLRFDGPENAKSYYQGYQARMTACGTGSGGLSVEGLWSEDAAAASVRRYDGDASFVEVSALQGSTVALLAAQSADPAREKAWTRTVVPELKAVIDQG